jgi:hypothetical protein
MRYVALLTACVFGTAAVPPTDPVERKLAIIQNGKAKPGSVLVFTVFELNTWSRAKAPEIVPEGLRQPKLELGNGTATGSALVDFLKLRHAAGIETNWLVAKLIQGEKRVQATVRIESAKGRATVRVLRVEIGGLAVSGATLDFLINTFFMPLYPNAKINEQFDLSDGVDRIEVTPAEARVHMRR